MANSQTIQIPDSVIAGCITALTEHLGRAPTTEQIARGIEQMIIDAFTRRDAAPIDYAHWLARVLGADYTLAPHDGDTDAT